MGQDRQESCFRHLNNHLVHPLSQNLGGQRQILLGGKRKSWSRRMGNNRSRMIRGWAGRVGRGLKSNPLLGRKFERLRNFKISKIKVRPLRNWFAALFIASDGILQIPISTPGPMGQKPLCRHPCQKASRIHKISSHV